MHDVRSKKTRSDALAVNVVTACTVNIQTLSCNTKGDDSARPTESEFRLHGLDQQKHAMHFSNHAEARMQQPAVAPSDFHMGLREDGAEGERTVTRLATSS